MTYAEMVAELNTKHGVDDADPEDQARRAELRATPSGRTAVAVMQALVPILGEMQQRIRELESQPRPKWRGAFKQGEVYHELSFVVCDGGLWVSKSSTMKRPGSDNSWQLCAKSGSHK